MAEREGGPGSGDPAAPLSHLDERGRARMVDVSEKAGTRREAEAAGRVVLAPSTLERIQSGGVPKGDVIPVAELAGVMAAKRTGELIPLCHPLPLTHVEVHVEPDPERSCLEIRAVARTTGPTGVEMEALTAVAVAALTVYDMCKAADREMRIEAVRLLRKSGGRSGAWAAE